MLSLFNNATALPFTGTAGVIHTPLHPGFSIGTLHYWLEREKVSIYQTFRLGYFYHRFSQHAVQLYTEPSFRFKIVGGLGLNTRIGAGYLHSWPDTEVFVLENGEYRKQTNLGRPQIMGSFSFGPEYDFEAQGLKVFIDYQFWVQAPFVRQYVPVLPNSAIHIGIVYNILRKS
ncbi:hypothetical protein RCC89_16560 [Cytophagaceae bacterium ABcell3]|nr:hypothetical protein RCC89_16560 [Cytophagaceae bacterium ABcell3]